MKNYWIGVKQQSLTHSQEYTRISTWLTISHWRTSIMVVMIKIIVLHVFNVLKLWVRIPCTRYNISDTVCQWLATGRWFSPGTPFPPARKIDRRDIAKILLKVALNTITLTITILLMCYYFRMRRNRGCFQFNNKDYRKSKLSERISIRQKMYMAN